MEDAPPIEPAKGDPALLVREELERISELIIRSDVPVGVALSGGLDSSAIAVLAQKNYPGTMQAITIGYEGTPWQDERRLAHELAAHLKMPIHDVEITCDEVVRSFPLMALDRDEPISDLSGIGYWSVMKKAHEQGLPVMLAGQGGDELFWGYGWVRDAAVATKRREAATSGNGSAVGLLDYLRLSRPPLSYTGGLRWARNLGGLRSALRQRREDLHGDPRRMVFYDNEPTFREAMTTAHHLYDPDFAQQALQSQPASLFSSDRPWPNIEVSLIRLITQTYLLLNGITQGDRLSMAWSVELRLPLVDYRLIELVVGLTKARPSVAGSAKVWLREALKGIVPQFVMDRRKRGFSPPWRQWRRALDAEYGHTLHDGFLRQQGALSAAGAAWVRRWLTPSVLGLPRNLSDRVLMLEIWGRELSASAAAPAPTTATMRAAAGGS
jgi:asparagine synthase (glutamine-hydrolysing)